MATGAIDFRYSLAWHTQAGQKLPGCVRPFCVCAHSIVEQRDGSCEDGCKEQQLGYAGGCLMLARGGCQCCSVEDVQ
jgi:hypothetical protein